jgi:short-subunit dehydrogenase
MTIKDYQHAMNVNFWAPLYTMMACLPHFRKHHEGKIVNITSIGGKIAVPHMLPYSASKFAFVGLSEGMQNELQKEDIQVMTVVPYLMQTGSPRNITVKGDHEKEYAWFKTLGSSPHVAQDPKVVAKKVIHALEYNKSQPTISYLERLASFSKELAPGFLRFLMFYTDKLMPETGPEGFTAKKGFESESEASQNKHAKAGNKAALVNNEL